MKKAILIISHGSLVKKTLNEVIALCEKLRNKFSDDMVEYAFLEIASPSIVEGIDQCVKKGVEEVLVTLNFLNAGRHVDVDIPAIIDQAKAKHPNVRIFITKPIGQHELIPNLFVDLINKNYN